MSAGSINPAMPTRYARDPDAVAFLTAAGIADGVQVEAINTRVLALKAAGIWSSLICLYPFVGGNATSHSYNLVNPATYRLTWVGTVTHDATGIKSDKLTGYGKTAFGAWGSSPLGFMGCYVRNFDTPITASTQISTGNDATYLSVSYLSQNVSFSFNATSRMITATAQYVSDCLVNRPNTTVALYNRGAFAYSYLSTADSIMQTALSILTRNDSNGTVFAVPGNAGNLSDAVCGRTGLTTGQIAAWYTIQQAYQTALGRQV